MTWRTLDEWNKKGKIVIKGTKCILRDPDGKCLFNDSQVKKERCVQSIWFYIQRLPNKKLWLLRKLPKR